MIQKSLLFAFLLMVSQISADDWPTFGGQLRSHISGEESLRIEWATQEPDVLWKQDIGLGYSSVIEYKGRAYCQGYNNGKNTLLCVDAEKGDIIWQHQYPCKKAPDYFQGGSRSTPTAFNDKIFLQSHEGDLYSLDAVTGKIMWSFNIVKKLGGERPQWGFAGAPLVVDDKVILQTGASSGSLVALNPLNGEVIWRSGSDKAGYSSPFIRRSNPNQIVVFNQFGLVLHELGNGAELKRYQHKTRYGINAAQPLEYKDYFLISSAYGKGAALVNSSKTGMQSVWESDAISCQMASLVRKGNYAYGIHGQAGARSKQATLFCVDIASGEKVWEHKGFGVGTLILVDQHLVILSDDGALTIAEAREDKFEEIESFQILSGKNNWTPLTYSQGRMHARGSQGRWVCLSMGKVN
ncbi:MAG: PQQ-binding-like beta-propeller repeat protein [Opitutales bacterium]|nr:PQQ-binding-like beta-propeller repeat protein [Opitutales bacterium]